MPRRCLHGVHRSARSAAPWAGRLCLGAACTGCISAICAPAGRRALCLGAACTGCIRCGSLAPACRPSLPRRCLHGVHPRHPMGRAPRTVFASALPARGASRHDMDRGQERVLCLGAACTGCIKERINNVSGVSLCLGAACTGCIDARYGDASYNGGFASALPARGASWAFPAASRTTGLCLGAACTGCIHSSRGNRASLTPLPRRCLHGVHLLRSDYTVSVANFASALPARGASGLSQFASPLPGSLPRRCLHGVHHAGGGQGAGCGSLPRRCLHGVHRDRPGLSSGGCTLPRRCLHGVHPAWQCTCGRCSGFASALPARGASRKPWTRWG